MKVLVVMNKDAEVKHGLVILDVSLVSNRLFIHQRDKELANIKAGQKLELTILQAVVRRF